MGYSWKCAMQCAQKKRSIWLLLKYLRVSLNLLVLNNRRMFLCKIYDLISTSLPSLCFENIPFYCSLEYSPTHLGAEMQQSFNSGANCLFREWSVELGENSWKLICTGNCWSFYRYIGYDKSMMKYSKLDWNINLFVSHIVKSINLNISMSRKHNLALKMRC